MATSTTVVGFFKIDFGGAGEDAFGGGVGCFFRID